MPSAGAFTQQYQAAFGTPGRYSASGYDGANVLLTAIAGAFNGGVPAPSGPNAVTEASALRQMVVANVASANLMGVTNPISFSATGDLNQGLISIEQLGAVNRAAAWKQVANESVQ